MKGNPLILCMSIDMWWLPWCIFGVKYFKQGVEYDNFWRNFSDTFDQKSEKFQVLTEFSLVGFSKGLKF